MHAPGEFSDVPPALPGDGIICLAHDWDSDPTSKTHIMRILSERRRILWVDSIGMRRPSATTRDLGRIVTKLRSGLAGVREAERNLFVLSPLVLPLPGVRAADRLNAGLLVVRLRQICRRLGMRRPILWTFMPNVAGLLGRLDERLVVYHCVDEYAAFSGVPREAIARMERELVARADLVFVSSATLETERRRINPDTHLVLHGVDVEHFAKALDAATAVPAEMLGLPRPVIGFFGLIADWVDVDLIRAIAMARREWSFVLVGKIATDVRRLQELPNVRLLGRKPYETLPSHCRGFDVGIVPFRTNELTLRANPLKLREYLAAGLPVVATPLPEVARYAGLVHLATDAAGFIAAIEASLAERDPESAGRRVEAMRAESWRRRVGELTALIAAKTARPATRTPHAASS